MSSAKSWRFRWWTAIYSIDVQSWDNFAEGITLQANAEKYRQRHGVYPEAILADQIYRFLKGVHTFLLVSSISLSYALCDA